MKEKIIRWVISNKEILVVLGILSMFVLVGVLGDPIDCGLYPCTPAW